jgi:hypothetical protein
VTTYTFLITGTGLSIFVTGVWMTIATAYKKRARRQARRTPTPITLAQANDALNKYYIPTMREVLDPKPEWKDIPR